MYKVLVQSSAADDFFRMLLDTENRTYFRSQFQEAEVIKAYGHSDYSNFNSVVRNNKALTLYSNLLPIGVTVEYHKSGCNIQNFDKLLLWESFPAEDNEKLESRVYSAYELKKTNSFFQIGILLYSGNVRTASTDLKSNKEALEESKKNCENKYRLCNVYAFASEENFTENLLYILIPSVHYGKKEIACQLKDILAHKEEDLKNIYYLYDYEMEFLSNQNGVLTSEQLHSVCGWRHIESKHNIVEAYFDTFISSLYYKSMLDEVVSYYKSFIKDICIWNEKDDRDKLTARITKELLHKREIYSNNALAAPKTELQYKSKEYTDKMLEFNKVVFEFFSDDVKKILCSYILEKIEIYRGLLK